jgi:hypothetical protein
LGGGQVQGSGFASAMDVDAEAGVGGRSRGGGRAAGSMQLAFGGQ